jgi:hypothetical protein
MLCGLTSFGRRQVVTQQANTQAETFTLGSGLTPQTRVILRRSGGSQLKARSSNSIEFSVETRDLAGTRTVLLQIGFRQASFSSQRFDLKFNQLQDFTFGSGGWIRHHRNSPGKL